RLMASERPDVVVSVLPVINGLLADAARRVGAPTEVVLTDWHAIHRLWVGRGVHHYTTPTKSARRECIQYGASGETIDVVGIPVRQAFAEAPARDRGVAQIGLDPSRLTILAMVGAEGSPRAFANLRWLARSEMPAQLMVICGRNEQL